MSLTDLQALYLPGAKRRAIKREIRSTKTNARRWISARIRKTRSKSLAVYRRQYFLSHAYADLQAAVRANEDIFLASIAAVAVLGYSLWVTSLNTLFIFLETAYEISDITGISMIFVTAIACSVVAVVLSWLLALLLNTVSLSIMDGATRKQNRSLRNTFRKSLGLTSRVAGAWLALLSLTFIPIALGAGAALVAIKASSATFDEVLGYLPYGIIVALSWIVTILMNYSLVPQVALFETGLPIYQTFRRSRQLVFRRGRLFTLIGHFCLLLGISLLAGIAYGIYRFVGISPWILGFLGFLGTMIASTSFATILYRKRKLARVN